MEVDTYSRSEVKHHLSNMHNQKQSFKVSCYILLITTKELEKIFGNFFRHLNNTFLMILSKILIW